MTIGENLKRARKKLNLNLDDVARATKIAKMFLIALENDDISSLPSGVYVRNFLRTYAKFLKIDVDIITAEYHEQYGIKPHFVTQQEQTKRDDLNFRRQRRKLQIIVLIILVALACATYFIIKTQPSALPFFGAKPTDPQTSLADVAPTGPDESEMAAAKAESAPPPVVIQTKPETTGDSSPTDLDEAERDLDPTLSPEGPELENEGEIALDAESSETALPLILPIADLDALPWPEEKARPNDLAEVFALEATGPVWVEVTIDGEVVTQRELRPGQTRYYRYGQLNSIRIGDISNIAIQDGRLFRAKLHERGWTLSLSFGPGALLYALDANLASRETHE